MQFNTYRNGSVVAQTLIYGGDIALWPPSGGFPAFRVILQNTDNTVNFIIDPSRLPTSTREYGRIYRDGEYLKIKT